MINTVHNVPPTVAYLPFIGGKLSIRHSHRMGNLHSKTAAMGLLIVPGADDKSQHIGTAIFLVSDMSYLK